MSFMSEAFIVGPDEGRRLDLGNFEALVLATAAQTSSEFTLLQVQGEPPDFGPPLHLHRDTAEAFYVLEGEYLMYVQDRQQLCPPGTFVYVPRDTPHTFKVVSAIPGKKLVRGIVKTCGSVCLSCLFVTFLLIMVGRPFDELAVDECGSGPDERHEVGCVHGSPAGLG